MYSPDDYWRKIRRLHPSQADRDLQPLCIQRYVWGSTCRTGEILLGCSFVWYHGFHSISHCYRVLYLMHMHLINNPVYQEGSMHLITRVYDISYPTLTQLFITSSFRPLYSLWLLSVWTKSCTGPGNEANNSPRSRVCRSLNISCPAIPPCTNSLFPTTAKMWPWRGEGAAPEVVGQNHSRGAGRLYRRTIYKILGCSIMT